MVPYQQHSDCGCHWGRSGLCIRPLPSQVSAFVHSKPGPETSLQLSFRGLQSLPARYTGWRNEVSDHGIFMEKTWFCFSWSPWCISDIDPFYIYGRTIWNTSDEIIKAYLFVGTRGVISFFLGRGVSEVSTSSFWNATNHPPPPVPWK